MKRNANYFETGYADLVLPRIMVVIIFILGLIAIPSYLNYDKQSKLMPVLGGLQQSVEEYYAKTQQLPELTAIQVVAGQGYVESQNEQFRIDLSLLGEEMTGTYLQLQPSLELGHLAWKCSYVGDVYKGDIPKQQDGICQDSRLALAERSLLERFVIFMKRIWGFALGCLLIIGFTFVFG